MAWTHYPQRKAGSKYGNEKAAVDGIVFDSKREARRYKELRLMEAAGEITGLRLQPEYELIPRYKKDGHTIRRTIYRADFEYRTRDGREIVEDVKGFKTDVYKLKKRLFEYLYPEKKIVEI